MTTTNINPSAPEPHVSQVAAPDATAGIKEQTVAAKGAETNEVTQVETRSAETSTGLRRNKNWRWVGAAVSFCLGWYLFSVFNNGGALHQASATSVPSATTSIASSIQLPFQADVVQQPSRSSTSAASAEVPVSAEQAQMAGGGNSDRLRKIFEKSMQSADALK